MARMVHRGLGQRTGTAMTLRPLARRAEFAPMRLLKARSTLALTLCRFARTVEGNSTPFSPGKFRKEVLQERA